MKRILNCPMENGSGGMPPKPADKGREGGPEKIQKQLRVLVIDDIPQIVNIMVRRLKRGGVKPENITTTGNGIRGLEMIQEGEFDLILTDNQMPGLDGQDMVKILSDEGKQEILDKIVLQTGQLSSVRPEIKELLNGRVLDKMEGEVVDVIDYLMKGGAVSTWTPGTHPLNLEQE